MTSQHPASRRWSTWTRKALLLRVGTAWLILFAMVVVSTISIGLTARAPGVAVGDAPSYLDAAYHLAHQHILSESETSAVPTPAITREPAYAFVLSLLMRAGSALSQFRPECLTGLDRCDPGIYHSIPWTNLVLFELTGIILFVVALLVCGDAAAALLCAAYLLFNIALSKNWWDPMSDLLGMFLVGLAMLAIAAAWRRRSPLAWFCAGLCFAALTLTKAAFFYFCAPATVAILSWLMLAGRRRASFIASAVLLVGVYGLALGGWIARNHDVSGEWRLTDTRGGIALSTREVFIHMKPAEYLTSLVYWTKGPGVGLARRWFSPELVERFRLEAPGGFYDEGQNGYGLHVAEIARTGNLTLQEASTIRDRQLVASIMSHPIAFAATTLPILYRGIWIDEFALVGTPVLVWIFVRSIRRRDWLLMSLLSIGIFNHLFYSLFSLGIPRYQTTAMPPTALAVGVAFTVLMRRLAVRADMARCG